MRIGFTIIYNGAHHLLHNQWVERLPKMLDYWVVVEGAAAPGGSTSWCRELDKKTSDDGTLLILDEAEYANNNVHLVPCPKDGWASKDNMVNAAVGAAVHLKAGVLTPIFLWQLDIDEQWTIDQMDAAECTLTEVGADCGCFHANHFVGPDIVAKGTWGEGNDPEDPLRNAYRRLWLWCGRRFETHEPPMLYGGNGKEVLLPQRFNHFSYRFEQDVLFKQRYYQGYEDLHKKWCSLQSETTFPQPVSRLIGGYWGSTDTVIQRI
jgi:hypothetical protein